MQVRFRYMELEIVNLWEQDSPDFDEVQREEILDLKEMPQIGDIIPAKLKHGHFFLIKKIIRSNKQREDGLEAFAQAELVSK